MKKILIVPNPKKDAELKLTAEVIEKLLEFSAITYLSNKYRKYDFHGVVYYSDNSIPADIDIVVVIGGDGSVIDASPIAISLNIPILGINLGKVGYLSEVDTENIDILSRLFSGEYNVEERMLLQVVRNTSGGEFQCFERMAVNDIVVSHADYFGIADFKVETGNGGKIDYRADGLVVSTPVGSTAYSLSAGGPVISHSLSTISLSPVAPHSFFNRTIVFPDDEIITVTNSGDQPANVSIDGRFALVLKPSEDCFISRSDKKIKMITFADDNMFSVLFKKIKLFENMR